MAVDFSNVQVGDRVKLSRENGDEYTFTVKETTSRAHYIESQTDAVHESEWDSLEILAKPLPTVNGSVIKSTRTGEIYVRVGSGWVDVNYGQSLVTTAQFSWYWDILFVPGEKESK